MKTTPRGQSTTSRSVRTFALDFSAALFVFMLVVGAFSVTSGHAFPAPPPPDLLPPALAFTQPAAFVQPLHLAAPFPTFDANISPLTTVVLALAFASLTAFNLAVWRHLRTAYASPRRRS
jgi:hypothetical protein